MRPGKPLISGRVMGTPMLGLPGNPVSSVASVSICGTRLMLGVLPENERGPPHAIAVLGADLGENDERRDYLRATLERLDSSPVATPAPSRTVPCSQPSPRPIVICARQAPGDQGGETVTVMFLDMGVNFLKLNPGYG